jgi:hypothetical protein
VAIRLSGLAACAKGMMMSDTNLIKDVLSKIEQSIGYLRAANISVRFGTGCDRAARSARDEKRPAYDKAHGAKLIQSARRHPPASPMTLGRLDSPGRSAGRASARLVRPIPEIFAVAGFILRVVVNRRHDRLHQKRGCLARLKRTLLGPSAKARRTFQCRAGNEP